MARAREEVRAARGLFRRDSRGFRPGPRHLLPGHGARALLHLVQVDEHPHLAAQHVGDHRREDVVHRAERVALRGLHLVGVGGDEDDRRVRRVLVLADEARGLQAVDVGHVDVEQDHRELALQHLAQRLGARAHHDQVLAQLLQDRLEDQQLFLQVIDDQDVAFFFFDRPSLPFSGGASRAAPRAGAAGRPAWTGSPRRRPRCTSRGRLSSPSPSPR